MAMATKDDMEIVVCPQDTKTVCHDGLDCKTCVQTNDEYPEHRNDNDDNTKRFSVDCYTLEALCSDCDKNDPTVAFCHTCGSSLCTFCYDCHIRQKKYKNHDVVNVEHVTTKRPEEGSSRLSSADDDGHVEIQKANRPMPSKVTIMEEQLCRIHCELEQIGQKLAMDAGRANDTIEQVYAEQIQHLQQQKEQRTQQLRDVALELENINLTNLKNVESIQKRLENLKISLMNATLPVNLVQMTGELAEINEKYETIMAQPVALPSLEFRASDANPLSLGEVICTDSEYNDNNVPRDHDQQVKHRNCISSRPRSNSVFWIPTIRIKVKRNKSDASLKRPSKRYPLYHSKDIRWPATITTNDGKMGRMFGVGFSKAGIWATADYSNHCVHIFDGNNKLIKILGSKGNSDGRFNHPTGVTFDREGCLYVSDYFNHRVQKFDANFEYLLQFGDEGGDDGQLNHPMGIVAYKDKVYVADSANSRIAVFYMNGTFCCNIVSGCLRDPHDVAINKTNKQLLVTDSSACCIRIYTLKGEYMERFSGFGADRCHLNHPASLAVDSNGFVYVTDTYNHRICIYNSIGMFVRSFGSCGNGEGQFNRPQGIAFSRSGSLIISDYANQRVAIFTKKFLKAGLK